MSASSSPSASRRRAQAQAQAQARASSPSSSEQPELEREPKRETLRERAAGAPELEREPNRETLRERAAGAPELERESERKRRPEPERRAQAASRSPQPLCPTAGAEPTPNDHPARPEPQLSTTPSDRRRHPDAWQLLRAEPDRRVAPKRRGDEATTRPPPHSKRHRSPCSPPAARRGAHPRLPRQLGPTEPHPPSTRRTAPCDAAATRRRGPHGPANPRRVRSTRRPEALRGRSDHATAPALEAPPQPAFSLSCAKGSAPTSAPLARPHGAAPR